MLCFSESSHAVFEQTAHPASARAESVAPAPSEAQETPVVEVDTERINTTPAPTVDEVTFQDDVFTIESSVVATPAVGAPSHVTDVVAATSDATVAMAPEHAAPNPAAVAGPTVAPTTTDAPYEAAVAPDAAAVETTSSPTVAAAAAAVDTGVTTASNAVAKARMKLLLAKKKSVRADTNDHTNDAAQP